MTKEKGRKWDGKSRVSNNTYRREFNRIFSKKDIKEIEKIVDEYEEKKEKTVSQLLQEGLKKEQNEEE
tara:strand:+ start:354 stop:557 length:204 start_codon:yes stop_codon:yes gene_type:complete